ncbi:MAG: hypothetical protein SFW67_11380 [Myxococcaceae bacterium]|nr:hypothetical protein [Myxococcaceae bacterium]
MGRFVMLEAPAGMVLGSMLFLSLVGLPEATITSRLHGEIVRLRREVDRLERRWADVSTECVCGGEREVVPVLFDLAKRYRAQPDTMRVEFIDPGERSRALGRRVFRVHVQASFHALCNILNELTQMKFPSNVDELKLKSHEEGLLDISFRLVVYDDTARAVTARATP